MNEKQIEEVGMKILGRFGPKELEFALALIAQARAASDDFGPPVPESIIDEIRCYGDYRADNDPRSGPQFGEVIKAMRRHYRAPVAAQQADIDMVKGALDLCEPEEQQAFQRIIAALKGERRG